MKKCSLVLCMLLLLSAPGALFAQIPNPGFEDWVAATQYSPAMPTGWTVNYLPLYATPVTPSNSPHSGSFALQGSTVSVQAYASLYPPFAQTVFPFAQRPGALTGYIKYAPAGRDSFEIFVAIYKGNLGTLVAAGGWGTATTIESYTKFSAPLEYFSEEMPDTAWIWMTAGQGDNDTVHLGTSFVIDDLAFEGSATAIDEKGATPATFALHQNYPNPFNPSTVIRFEIPQATRVRLSVYNLLGQELAVLVDEQRPAGAYEQRFGAAGLPSGTYFYRIEAGSNVQVRKMTVVK